MRKLVSAIALLCMALVASPAIAAEAAANLVDNPTYQSWAKYKPGTSVTYAQEMGMGAMNMKMETTQTLKDLTPEQAVVEMVIKNEMMPGGGQTQTMTIPAKVEPAKAETVGKMPEGFTGETKSLGKETIKVEEKEYQTEVTEFKGEQAQHGMKFEGKSWTSPQVPSQMVKMEMKSVGEGQHAGMTITMTLKSFTEGK